MSRKKIFRTSVGFWFITFLIALPSISFAKTGEWTTKSPMPTARYPATCAVNGKIYAIGGGRTPRKIVEEYNPGTDTWTRKANMPTARGNLSASAVNGKIYVIGGNNQAEHFRTVEEYDPVADTWRKRADMPTGRRGLSTSVVNGKIYAIGGYHRGGTGLGEALVAEYDPVKNTWENKADMLTGRAFLSTSAVNGKIYTIGGNIGLTAISNVEEYDPATDTWTRKTDMPTARTSLSTSVVDGKIYAIGGTDGSQYLSTVEVYDPATDTWTVKTETMPTGRFGLGTSVVDGRIYAIGGQPGPYPELTGATEEYQPIAWGFARVPVPANGSLLPDTSVILNWQSGDFAASHDVYFGENYEDVNDGLNDTFRGNQSLTFLGVGYAGSPYPDGLVRGNTYYWRIDEVNNTEPDSPWKGPIWSFTIQPQTAYNPNPVDGAEFVDLDVELNWSAGVDAALHTVYFGDDFDEVNNATGGANQARTTYTPGPLEFGKTYFWRVDESSGGRGGGTQKGNVWSFITQGATSSPDPYHDATSVEMNPILSWIPADDAATHLIYFGIDKELVRNANTDLSEYKGTQTIGIERFIAGILSPDTTYYWRIDEVSSDNPESPLSGSVWSFTTGDHFVIDDFEDYKIGSNEIWWSWKDGTGYANHPTETPYTGNGTGSKVGDESTGSTAFEDRSIGGGQSMPFWYDNDKTGFLKYSEATLRLTSPHDWTENGVRTLSIWCVSEWDWDRKVSANDAESMYVVLNDSVVVYHNDPEITKVFYWTEWKIDLQKFADQGVDLTNIHTIGLGFGNRDNPQSGGSGKMYFDDIRVRK